MKSFEPAYKKLNELFIETLPAYIQKVNEEHNDGIIITEFENKQLEDPCSLLPSFDFTVEESEYEEKDRILENTIFTTGITIHLQKHTENQFLLLCRYEEAIEKMFNENQDNTVWQDLTILKMKNNKIIMRITI